MGAGQDRYSVSPRDAKVSAPFAIARGMKSSQMR